MMVTDPAVRSFFREIRALLNDNMPASSATENGGWSISKTAPAIEQMRAELNTAQTVVVHHHFALSYESADTSTEGLVLYVKKGTTTVTLNGVVEVEENSAWLSFAADGTLSYTGTQDETHRSPKASGSVTTQKKVTTEERAVTAFQLLLAKNLVRTVCQHIRPRP